MFHLLNRESGQFLTSEDSLSYSRFEAKTFEEIEEAKQEADNMKDKFVIIKVKERKEKSK